MESGYTGRRTHEGQGKAKVPFAAGVSATRTARTATVGYPRPHRLPPPRKSTAANRSAPCPDRDPLFPPPPPGETPLPHFANVVPAAATKSPATPTSRAFRLISTGHSLAAGNKPIHSRAPTLSSSLPCLLSSSCVPQGILDDHTALHTEQEQEPRAEPHSARRASAGR